MTITMKACRPFTYAGRRLKVGAIFEARGQSDAKVLAAVGHAQFHTEPPVVAVPRQQYQTRVMTAAPMVPYETKAAPKTATSAKPAAKKPDPKPDSSLRGTRRYTVD